MKTLFNRKSRIAILAAILGFLTWPAVAAPSIAAPSVASSAAVAGATSKSAPKATAFDRLRWLIADKDDKLTVRDLRGARRSTAGVRMPFFDFRKGS